MRGSYGHKHSMGRQSYRVLKAVKLENLLLASNGYATAMDFLKVDHSWATMRTMRSVGLTNQYHLYPPARMLPRLLWASSSRRFFQKLGAF